MKILEITKVAPSCSKLFPLYILKHQRRISGSFVQVYTPRHLKHTPQMPPVNSIQSGMMKFIFNCHYSVSGIASAWGYALIANWTCSEQTIDTR